MFSPPPAADTTSPAHPDFKVPVSAINGPGNGQGPAPQQPKPAPAPKPPSIDQRFVDQQQRQNQADQTAVDAIAEQRDISTQKADLDSAAYDAHAAEAKRIESVRKEWEAEAPKIRAEKQAYVDATLKAADDYKVDPNKYWDSMGMGQHIGLYIAMAISGIGDALQHKSGPNPVIQMLQDKMHESVVLQQQEREALAQKAGRAEHALDKFDQFSTNKQAQIDLMDARNDKFLANAIAAAGAKTESAQAQANAKKAVAELLQSSADKALKAAETASTHEYQMKQAAAAQTSAYASVMNARENVRHNHAMEGLTEEQRQIEAAKLLAQGKDAQAKLVRERALGGEVKKDASGKPVLGPDGKPQLGLITDSKGEVFIPNGTETSVTKLQEGHNAALKLLGTLDEIRKLGPEWLSNTANSDKKQKLDELFGTAKLQAIAANNLGVPTGKDVELALGTLGTSDPTRFRDSLAGLNEARSTIIRNHNVQLHTAGLDRDWTLFDPLSAPKSEQTQVEKIATTLKREPDQNPERAQEQAMVAAHKAGGSAQEVIKAGREAYEAARSGTSISQEQRQGIANLKALAISGGPEAQAAISTLRDIVGIQDQKHQRDQKGIFGTVTAPWQKESLSPMRTLAAEALSEIQSAATPPEPLTSAGPSYDPNGYSPQALVERFQRPAGAPTITGQKK